MSSILVIDAENIHLKEEELVYIKFFYNIEKIYIYFDMEKNNISQHYIDWIYKYNTFLLNVPSIGGKNSVDLQITIDITEQSILNKNLKNVILASNDRDFFPLCLLLKKYNKKIIIVAYNEICKNILNHIDYKIILNDISIDLKIVLFCFILCNQNNLSIQNLKKIIKKLNKKKKMKNYNQLLENIILWNDIFLVIDNIIFLKHTVS
jgi:hypothetical protein